MGLKCETLGQSCPKQWGREESIGASALSRLEWSSYHSAHQLIGLSPGIADGIEKRGIPEKESNDPKRQDHVLLIKCSTLLPNGVEKSDLMAIFTGAHGIATD